MIDKGNILKAIGMGDGPLGEWHGALAKVEEMEAFHFAAFDEELHTEEYLSGMKRRAKDFVLYLSFLELLSGDYHS